VAGSDPHFLHQEYIMDRIGKLKAGTDSVLGRLDGVFGRHLVEVDDDRRDAHRRYHASLKALVESVDPGPEVDARSLLLAELMAFLIGEQQEVVEARLDVGEPGQ
jgi:hypothetical protein